jgi:hypothetical protein
MDQRLNQAGLRQPKGASKIRSIGDRGFERTGTLDTATSETPNPDIEPGIGILQVQVSGDFSLWEINPIFFLNYDSGCVTKWYQSMVTTLGLLGLRHGPR